MKAIKKQGGLTKKEIAFCRQYIKTGNAKEAAYIAGYKSNAGKVGEELLARPDISAKIDEIYKSKKKNLIYRATTGYERLAFGSISDCIRLLFEENLCQEELDKIDLFNIAEIKKPKSGAMEIKFFDRIRALEKLEQIDMENSGEKEPFYYALEQGIKKLGTGEHILTGEN